MKHLGRLATLIMLIINIVFVGLLLFAAYSPNINPALHPIRACMGLAFPIFVGVNICFLFFWLIFRIRLMLVSLVALLLCTAQIRTYFPINFKSAKVPEEAIKVLSYNVMTLANLQKTDNQNPILNYLQTCHADIICLQEYMVTTNRKYVTQQDIDQAMKAYPYRHVQGIGEKGGSNALACFSKYPILSARRIEYPSKNNGSVLYEIAIDKDTVTVINNHLESNKLTAMDKVAYEDMLNAPEADKVKKGAWHLVRKLRDAQIIRAKQAQTVAEAIKNSPYKTVIVCGDFNDSPISYAHKTISENLNDAFVTSGNGFGISYNQHKFYFRIDNILLSKNIKAHRCKVDRTIKHSDHYPIWAYVSFNSKLIK